MAEKTNKEAELYLACKVEFKGDALSTDNSRGFALTSIGAQYIVERMNDVFGIFGWTQEGEFERTDKGVVWVGVLKVRQPDGAWHNLPAVGYDDVRHENWGDAYKGALTAALSKAASRLGIGNEVFKGNVPPPTDGKPASTPPAHGAGYTAQGQKADRKEASKTPPIKSDEGDFWICPFCNGTLNLKVSAKGNAYVSCHNKSCSEGYWAYLPKG